MKHRIIIDGHECTLEALGQPIDDPFDRLYGACAGKLALPWQEFVEAATQYFDAHPERCPEHDRYFENSTVIWRKLLKQGRYDEAEHVWELALEPVQQWERAHPGNRIRKGTPYYFWAGTVRMRGDTDKGYLLAHQAVDEDIRSSGQGAYNNPAYALVSLNYEKVHQFFRQWVVDQAGFLDCLLANYRDIHNRTLSLTDVKCRFLDSPPTPETVSGLAYSLARLMKLSKVPPEMTMNPFAGQLEINLLFDVILVIDTAVKAKRTAGRYFSNRTKNLLTAASEPLTNGQIGDLGRQFENCLDGTLQSALDGTLIIQPNITLTRLQCDVALAHGIRNHAAHNVDSAPVIWDRFPEVQQALFRVLFGAIDHFY